MTVPVRYLFGLLLAQLLATAAASAQEATCRDISFPRHLQVSGSDLTLNGLGVRKATFLKVNVYVAEGNAEVTGAVQTEILKLLP